MSFFDQVFQQLFGGPPQRQKVISHEIIRRKKGYIEKYQEYVNSPEFHDLVKSIYSSYELKLNDIEKMPQVHVLSSEYANGLAISLDENMEQTETTYLFDWLKDQVITLGYQMANSDCIIVDKGTFIEMKEKHYLKPPVGKKKILDQKFGNILIEYVKIDDKPNYIKLTASIYSDRKYTQAKEFEELAEYLFT